MVVAKRVIPGGVYVMDPTTERTEPSAINRLLPIDFAAPDRDGRATPYYPSYASFTPGQRGGYVEWHAGGRNDVAVGVGFPFLYFAGVERRVLVERHLCDAAETRALVEEVVRLRKLYGHVSKSFARYTKNFLVLMTAVWPDVSVNRPFDPQVSRVGRGLTAELLTAVGLAAFRGTALPSELAFAWFAADGEAKGRRAMTRCPDRVLRLFVARFAEACRDVKLPNHGPRLVVAYAAANAVLGAGGPVGHETLVPDVRRAAALRKVVEIGVRCCVELDAFARRRTAGPLTLRSVALLPMESLLMDDDDCLREFREWLRTNVSASRPSVVPATELLARWSDRPVKRLGRDDLSRCATLLETNGYGMEPDPRRVVSVLTDAESVAIFVLPPGGQAPLSESFVVAAALIELAAAVTATDAVVIPPDRERLARLAELIALPRPHRARLRAVAALALVVRPDVAAAAKSASVLGPIARRRLGELLVAVAIDGGPLTAQQTRMLTDIFVRLGLDPGDAYRLFHVAATNTVAAEIPVMVRPLDGVAPAPGFRIPIRTQASDTTGLDPEAVRVKREATAAVALFLDGILGDVLEGASEAFSTSAMASSETPACGLDTRHAELVRRIADRYECARAEFEALCAELGLPPGGALEAVNDAALSRFGRPLLEGDDPIEIDGGLAAEMLR